MQTRTSLVTGWRYLFLILAGGCCSAGLIGGLPVTLHPQETGMWCWAASGQMVMDYLGSNVAQCTQANDRFGRTDCPCNQCGSNPTVNPPCVNGGWPDFGRYGFSFQRTTDTALSWNELKSELSSNRWCGRTPVPFSWHWNGGGGHMMVAYGYVSLASGRYVAILDPWSPCNGDTRIITYEAYVSGTTYSHWDDFYRIRRN
jgi:hypothetical protein